jgi:hypothetical protein
MPEQYFDLTVGEILRNYRGYQKRESYQWERARFIAWYGSLPYLKKGTNMMPEDIMTLPTDPSAEEMILRKEAQEKAAKETMDIVFETYRQMGYSV